MKKIIILIALCSVSLFSCKSGGENNNSSANNDKEKELLEREKALLEKENASLKDKQEDKQASSRENQNNSSNNSANSANNNTQAETPVQNDGQEQYYEGNVGKLPAHFTLTWGTDNNISGYYSQANNSSFTRDGVDRYQLSGSNPSNGQLVLNEFTNGAQTATIKLSKSIQGQTVSWNGTMYNTDGKTFPVSIRRVVR